MSTRLRDLLNVKTAESLEGAAGPIAGNQIVFQNTCYEIEESNYHNACCVAFIAPAGVTCAIFEVWGGGGGGSGLSTCCDDDACFSGPGGGAGAYVVRCLNNISEGDRFDMIIGRATDCSSSMDGCHGCFSCLCGPNAQLCAQGGGGGCLWCNWSEGNICCSEGSNAYGGDINIDGKCGKYIQCCNYTDGWPYNQFLMPYPGGLTNLCGGWVQVQQRECTSCNICNYCTKCDISDQLMGAIGGGNFNCYGYIPGIPGASYQQFCQCECVYPCECGQAGNPGMIRVTYK